MQKDKKPEKPLLEDWQVEAVKRRIDEVLRLRCINVVTTLELVEREGDRGGKQHLTLTSTAFNTVPVIHSPITIEEFGATVMEDVQELKDGTTLPCVRFWVTVSARYEGNGTTLFTVSGRVSGAGRHVFFEEDTHKGSNDGMRDTVSRYDIIQD